MPSRRVLLPTLIAAILAILTAVTPADAQRGGRGDQDDSDSSRQRDPLALGSLALAGLTAYTQAAIAGGGYVELCNAIDATAGN